MSATIEQNECRMHMGFEVMAEPCKQCLFGKERLVPAERVRDILMECEITDTHFACHLSSMKGGDACCAAFFDRATTGGGKPTQLMRIAQRLGAVVRIPVPECDLEMVSERERKRLESDDADIEDEDYE